jgi:Cu(I)/Ag(I) efflux system membrane fusion protein
MKKMITIAVLVALVAATIFAISGCGKSQETTTVEKPAERPVAQYACSMKCEGEKTYANAGSCPVCGMALTKTE